MCNAYYSSKHHILISLHSIYHNHPKEGSRLKLISFYRVDSYFKGTCNKGSQGRGVVCTVCVQVISEQHITRIWPVPLSEGSVACVTLSVKCQKLLNQIYTLMRSDSDDYWDSHPAWSVSLNCQGYSYIFLNILRMLKKPISRKGLSQAVKNKAQVDKGDIEY